MPVRIEGEALTGKRRADAWAVAVSRAEPGNAAGKEEGGFTPGGVPERTASPRFVR